MTMLDLTAMIFAVSKNKKELAQEQQHQQQRQRHRLPFWLNHLGEIPSPLPLK